MSAPIPDFAISVITRATMMLAVGLIGAAAMRRFSAEVRHLLLLVTVGSVAMLPFVLGLAPRWSVPLLSPTPASKAAVRERGTTASIPTVTSSATTAARDAESQPQVAGAYQPHGVVPEPIGGPLWSVFLIAVWAIGALVVGVRVGLGHSRLRRIAAQAREPNSNSWKRLLEAERTQMGVGKPVRLLVSNATTTPVTWGIRSPVILLPNAAGDWAEDRLRAVLRHELVHIAQGDAQARWLAALLCALYWFHPLAWLAARALRAESESACDDHVLVSGMLAGEYADHLLAVARATRAAGPSPFLAVRMASQPEIARRIFAVLDESRRRRVFDPPTRAVIVVAGTVTLLAVGGCQFVQREAGAQPIPGTRLTEQGVRIISHPASALAATIQLELETTPLATTESAGAGAETDLRYVRKAVLLSDGRIAAFRSIDPGVFIFGPDGQFQRRIGKLGKQPGEFMAPFGMTLLAGDTLYIPDYNNRRVNWITADAGFVRTAGFELGADMFRDPRGRLRGGGVVLASPLISHDMSGGTSRPPTPIALTDSSLTSATRIATVPGFEMVEIVTNYRGRRRSEAVPLRFGDRSDAVAWDTVIAVATGASGYEIEQRNAQGTVIARVRVDQSRRPTTHAMREARIAAELAQIAGPQSERFVDVDETRRQARENPFADSLPPYFGLFATKQGTLWVVDAIAPSDTEWTATAFRADGAIVGRLRARMSAFPLHFDDDRVILRGEDADGRVVLRVHRMRPASGPR